MKYLLLGSLLAIVLLPLPACMNSKAAQEWLEAPSKNANFQKKDQAELMAKVAGGYGTIGEAEQTVQILDKALTIAKPLPENSFKDLALREICHQYVAIDYLDKAIESANAMPQDTLRVYCLTAIAAKYRIQGNKIIATRLIDQALQTTNAIPVENSDNQAVVEGSDHQIFRGVESKSLGLLNVIKEQIASGQFDQASQIAKTIPLTSYQQEAYTKILKAKETRVQTLKPEQEKAKGEPLSAIPTKVCTGVPASELLRCAFQKTTHEDLSLESILRRFDQPMIGIEQTAQNCSVQPLDQPNCVAQGVERTALMGIFNLFLEESTKGEKPAETQEILAQALQIIQSTRYESVKPEAMTQIAINYAKVGQKAKAMEILATALSIAKNYGHPKHLVWF